MPELPEVEAVCRKLRREASGASITSAHIQRRRVTSPQDPSETEALLCGRTIQRVDRRGKNILIAVSGGTFLHVHLRMTGNLYVIPDHRFRPHATSAWCEFDDGRGLLFEDPRGLGTFRVIQELPGNLGVEPLSRQFTAALFLQLTAESRQPAKLFLLGQRRVAGLGNIYAAEALYRSRIDPRKPISAVAPAKLRALHAAIVGILRDAVKSACIAYSRPGGFREAEGFVPSVYDREGEACHRCWRAIRRITQGGRSTYFCPQCQR